MATTPVLLKVDGFTDREVIMFTYSFNQATDTEGQMSGIPRGGRITIRLKVLNEGNRELLSWMIAPYLNKDGKIVFNRTDKDGQERQTIEFKDGYCVNYVEYYEDKMDGYEEITISCREITNGPVSYHNQWA